ncbi:hypothetical protein ENKO_406 [Klebsiella phage fENko-Kae01]|nr:hypothetical protein [Klebsiella phage fENko-Kae01]
MSIKIDPETDKAVDPQSIGKDMSKRAILAVIAVCVFVAVWKFMKYM